MVAIKGMEYPSRCSICRLCDLDDDCMASGGFLHVNYEVLAGTKNPKCPLVECPLVDFSNMTNGDVIKAIFPNAEMHEFKCLNAVNVVTDKSLNAQTFELDWWNSPYKENK